MRIATFLVAVSAIFSLSVEAKWSQQAYLKLNEINDTYKELQPGDMVTAWGGWKRTKLIQPELKGNIITVTTTENMAKEAKAYFYQYPTKRPVPLFVYFPGIFGQPGNRMTDEFISRLEQIDSHVLVIPNFLSENWVRSQPDYTKHPAKTEIMLIAAIWKEAVGRLSAGQISSVHIFGESLGAIMASAWTAQAEISPVPNTLNLLWPPANLEVAMQNLDKYLDEASRANCSDFLTFPLFMNYFLIANTPQGITPAHAKCLSAWGARKGFIKQLEATANVINSLKNAAPYKPRNFQTFFETLQKPLWDLIVAKDETMDLGFWLKKINGNKPSLDLRILTSFDDFLNQGASLTEVARKSGYALDSVFVFNWGGHEGPLATPEFMSVLKSEFVPAKSDINFKL